MTWVLNREKQNLVWVISREEVVRLLFHDREVDLIQAEAEGMPFYDMTLRGDLERRYDLEEVAKWFAARHQRRSAE